MHGAYVEELARYLDIQRMMDIPTNYGRFYKDSTGATYYDIKKKPIIGFKHD